METTIELKVESQELRGNHESEAAKWLRIAADRRERRGEPVTALLFRNEAFLLEQESGMEVTSPAK